MSQKLTEDDLDELKDKALEYLPIVKQILLSNSNYITARGDSYWTELCCISSSQKIDRNNPKIQILATRLIKEICSFHLGLSNGFKPYIEDDCKLSDKDKKLYLSMTPDELRNSSLNTVTKTARKFYDVEKKAIETKIYADITLEITTKIKEKAGSREEKRMHFIYEWIKKKQYSPNEIHKDDKVIIKDECKKHAPKTLGFTDATFYKAWTKGSKLDLFGIKNKEKYRQRFIDEE
jgi:hypothetical protein